MIVFHIFKAAMPLTVLPAEIRNKIYSMVLSEPEPLVLWMDPAGIPRVCRRHSRARPTLTYLFSQRTSGSAVEFNQLKYVSRMLFMETRGLERRYNTISATAAVAPKARGEI